MARRVTLADIARHAGVSRSTASLVVRETGALSDSTRERVRASMEALGYVYHRGAASLRGRRTQSVGFILPDMATGFWSELSVGLEEGLAQAGAVTLMLNSFDDADRQDLLFKAVLERQVDGLIVVPASDTLPDFGDRLASAVPAVIAIRSIRRTDVPYVGINNLMGGRLAGEHLVFHGASRIAYIGGVAGLSVRRDRIGGLRQYLRSGRSGAQLEVDLPGPALGAWAYESTREILRERGDFADAIVCHNDAVAFGVLRALREAGRFAERAIPVVSYDNVAEAALWEPPLTTVAASGYEVGRRSAEMLLTRISDVKTTAKRLLIRPELVVRESCGCSPGAEHDAAVAPDGAVTSSTGSANDLDPAV